MDGWMDRSVSWWMDGWIRVFFFGVYFSKTTLYIILIISGPLRRRFKVSFVKKFKIIKTREKGHHRNTLKIMET